MVMCPATPTCPASTTWSPIVVLPAMPTCATSSDVLADRDAVRDLDEVVDLGPAPDPRLAHGRPIDRRVRADLDVVFDDDDAVLRDLVVDAVRVGDVAVAVAADHGAVLHHHTAAQHRTFAHRHARVHDAVLADPDAGPEHHVRVEHDAVADVRRRRRRPRRRRWTRPRRGARRGRPPRSGARRRAAARCGRADASASANDR